MNQVCDSFIVRPPCNEEHNIMEDLMISWGKSEVEINP